MPMPACPTPEGLREFVKTDPLIHRLAEVAQKHQRPMALVGGCVRDWLLGREPLDWDLVVPGDPTPLVKDLTRALGGPVVTLDAAFGVVRTKLKSGLTIDFVRQQGETLEEDLWRRDLTINAIALDLATGELVDPTGGLADLERRCIRTVSLRNLQDDPLRMLRVFRFAASLGYPVDGQTLAWIRGLAPELVRPAPERVLAELSKLLASDQAAAELAAMAELGLLPPLFPELAAETLGGAAARLGGLLDAWKRLVLPAGLQARLSAWLKEAVAGDRPRRYLLALTAIGLPEPGAMQSVAERLRLSNKELQALVGALAAVPQARALLAAPDERSAYRFSRTHAESGLLALLLVPQPDAWGVALSLVWRFLMEKPARLLNGNELMKELGLAPGPHLASLLAGIEEAQALGQVRTREEALAWAARMIQQGE